VKACASGTVLYAWSGTSFTQPGLTNCILYASPVCAADTAALHAALPTASATPQAGDSTAPTGSLGLNGGAAATNSPAVTVSLSGTDAVGVTGYYVATSATVPSATAAGWVAVGATPSYSGSVGTTLSPGDG